MTTLELNLKLVRTRALRELNRDYGLGVSYDYFVNCTEAIETKTTADGLELVTALYFKVAGFKFVYIVGEGLKEV